MLWIDATEDGLPAGQLPARDQHRRALVIAADTRDLTMTPVAAPRDNLIREVRTVHLAEHDRGAITEVSEEHGIYWDGLRGWVRDAAPTDVSKSLTSYAEKHYGGTLVRFSDNAPTDVTRPFQLTVEIGEAQRAFTDRAEAVVWLQPAATLNKLGDLFTSPDAAIAAQVASRTIDYEFVAPHAYEIEYRIELPPGYEAPALVPREVLALGPLSLTTTRRVDGRTIVVTYRLDTGKRRLTPAELVAARAAVRKAQDGDFEKLVIPLTAARLMDQDKVTEAIAACQRLIALHPKEALHWGQLASVYRRAGLVAAARRAARQGTIVEPTSSDAFAMLGFELRLDSTARLLGFDSDRPGAIAAFRKALALDPTHDGVLEALAALLMVDEHGTATSSVRDLREAITMWQRAKDTSGDGAYDQRLVETMLLAGAFADAAAAAKELPVSDDATTLQVAALAGAGHVDDALARARARATGKDLVPILDGARGWLMRARAYDAARPLGAARFAIVPDPASEAMMRRLRPIDVDGLDRADPRRPVLQALLAVASVPVARPAWDAALGRDLEAMATATIDGTDLTTRKLVPDRVLGDVLAATMDIQVDGSARDGWRIGMGFRGVMDHQYVELDRGVATLIGSTALPKGVGQAALRRLGARDLAGATRWLQWLSDDLARGGTHEPDPATQLALQRYRDEVVRAGTAPPAREIVELAAALIAGDRAPMVALPVLRRCAAPGDEIAAACRGQRLAIARRTAQWRDAAAVAAEITAADPARRVGIEAHARALANQHKLAEAAALLDSARRAAPDDHALLVARTEIAMASGVWRDAEHWMDQLTGRADVTADDLNNLAWARLGLNPDPAAAQALATRAEAMEHPLSPQLANTLAAVAADAGEPVKAWRYAEHSWDPRVDHAPHDADWYVLGRIAEAYGMRDDAIAAYRKVAKPDEPSPLPTSHDLAAQALARLHAKP